MNVNKPDIPPRDRIGLELLALRRTFALREGNSDFQKYLVLVLVITWAIITLGIAFGVAIKTPVYGMLSALIWMLIGRVWGKEAKALIGEQGPLTDDKD